MQAKRGTFSANPDEIPLLSSLASRNLVASAHFHVITENLDRCPNCGGKEFRKWHACNDRLYRLSEQTFIYSKCLLCGVFFLSPRPLASEVHKFYPIEYAPFTGAATKAETRCEPAPAQQRRPIRQALLKAARALNAATDRFFPDPLAAELHDFYPRQEREKQLLDFGCGSDIFLNQARNLGWDTIGIDFSPIAVEQVRRSGHKAILASPAMWQEIEDESLDLVRMNHVLEHLYDGREVLAAIRSKMKAGARLHIAVPNPNGVTSRLFRSWAALVSEPRHVILYPPRVLASLLAQVGFSQVRVCHETVTKDFLRSLGLLWHERGWIRHEEIDQMKQRKGLAELLFTPARLAACVGVADRIHAFVRK